MSWGHIVSEDLLHWKRLSTQPALQPGEDYDGCGIFTGCFAPSPDKKQLIVFYSSVRTLNFHWSSYPRGPAGLAVASSDNGGSTWVKHSQNPILNEEPKEIQVTGFRDPYIASWPAMDQVRGQTALYGLISGGIQGSGPTCFLYAIQPTELTTWKYLGPLVDIPISFQPSNKWSGNYGINWECTNFMTLGSGPSVSQQFLVLSTEVDVERDNVKDHYSITERGQLWISGNLVRSGQNVKFRYRYGGFFDHGCYYAANSSIDALSHRRIVYGWIPEYNCPQDYALHKGWNGCQAIPRELFLLSIQDVVGALRSPLTEISCVETQQEPCGSTTLYTLGIRPISEFSHLREDCLHSYASKAVSLPQPSSTVHFLASVCTPTWELEGTVSLESRRCETVGFYVQHSSDYSHYTRITFDVDAETITLRSRSDVNGTAETSAKQGGPFTLFTTRNTEIGGGKTKEVLEKFHLRIIADGDILEIYANDRFALATMIYNAGMGTASAHRNGITAFATTTNQANDGGAAAVFEDVNIWDGLNGMKSLIGDD